MASLAQKECVPCRGGVPPLKGDKLKSLTKQLDDWRVLAEHHLEKDFAFPDFALALDFTNRVGQIAEKQGHHPDIFLSWGHVGLKIWTHKIDGLAESDFVLAAKIDALKAKNKSPQPPERKSAMSPSQNDIVITRVFNASRENVWTAWTEPRVFKKWWGPKDFTCPMAIVDFRSGGKYLSCMQNAQGQKFWSTGTYREIVPLERIVCSDSFADENGNVVPASHYGMPGENFPLELTVKVEFEDLGDTTRMTLTHIGFPPGEMQEMCAAGWNQSFDKLAAALEPPRRALRTPAKSPAKSRATQP